MIRLLAAKAETGPAISALAAGLLLSAASLSANRDEGIDRAAALALHNGARAGVGVSPLVWSERLATEAQAHASVLAASGELRHHRSAAHSGAGENLWLGRGHGFRLEDMIGRFLAERRHFRPGAFPAISTSGTWRDAAHYSQIVWRDSRELGCALAQREGITVLVCRYHPAGNVVGQRPY